MLKASQATKLFGVCKQNDEETNLLTCQLYHQENYKNSDYNQQDLTCHFSIVWNFNILLHNTFFTINSAK